MIRPPTPAEVLRSHDFDCSGRLNRELPPLRFAAAVLEVDSDRRIAWAEYLLNATVTVLYSRNCDFRFFSLCHQQQFNVVILCRPLPESLLLTMLANGGCLIRDW